SPDTVRSMFTSALSDKYRQMILVSDINHRSNQNIQHHTKVERHGAIRLRTAGALAMMRRSFSVMGMCPVRYYDLSVASLPIRATCFRPLAKRSLARNPFRVFAFLLHLELIQDESLRPKAVNILRERKIFTPRCVELIQEFENSGLFSHSVAEEFINDAIQNFQWLKDSTVDMKTY
ncbi:hypothetical protein B0T10DRAFT_407120, partial [Thelonectria olida]